MVYKLVPLLLTVLQFLLQIACFLHRNAFDPQRVQFEIIADHVHSVIGRKYQATNKPINGLAAIRQSTTTGIINNALADTDAGFVNMLRVFFKDPLYCFFSFIELFTVTYVWMELEFSPVSCGNQFRLSHLYYPLVLTALDFGKLNFYLALKSLRAGEMLRAAASLLNLEIFFIYAVTSVLLAVVFVVGICKSCFIFTTSIVNRILPGCCPATTTGAGSLPMNTGVSPDWPAAKRSSTTCIGGNVTGTPGAGSDEPRDTYNVMHDSIYFYNNHLAVLRNRDNSPGPRDTINNMNNRQRMQSDVQLVTLGGVVDN